MKIVPTLSSPDITGSFKTVNQQEKRNKKRKREKKEKIEDVTTQREK